MRIHLIRSLLFVGVVVAIALCPWLIRRQRRPGKISPQRLLTLLSQSESPLVLDVRNPDEFVGERGHIGEAVLCPLPELDKHFDELTAHRTRTIVTV